MKKYFIIGIITFFYLNSSAQNHKNSFFIKDTRIKFIIYQTLSDYRNNKTLKLSQENLLHAHEVSDKYIWVKKFLSVTNGKERKKIRKSFAIEYDGIKYFNLQNSVDANAPFTYVRFDIEGKVFAIFIDKNSPLVIRDSGKDYSSGLLVTGPRKWGKSWLSENGIRKQILFLNPQWRDYSGNIVANYLTRSQAATLFNLQMDKKQLRNISFEEIVELIKKYNQEDKI